VEQRCKEEKQDETKVDKEMWILEREIKSKRRFGVEIDRVADKGIIAGRRCGRLDIGATRNNGIRNDEMDRGWYVGKSRKGNRKGCRKRM